MSQDLQQARYDQLLRRAGGLIGPGSKVSEVLAELFPVIDVESVPGELLKLMGTDIALGGTDTNGVAATNQHSQIFNPVGSGRICTVTHVAVRAETTQQIVYGLVNATLVSLTALTRMRDSRFVFNQRPVMEVRNGVNAAVAPANGRFWVQANTTYTLTDPNGVAVLHPGFGLEFSTSTVNTDFDVGYHWRERQAEESELNF